MTPAPTHRIQIDWAEKPLPLFATVTVSSPYALRPLLIYWIGTAWRSAIGLIDTARGILGQDV